MRPQLNPIRTAIAVLSLVTVAVLFVVWPERSAAGNEGRASASIGFASHAHWQVARSGL